MLGVLDEREEELGLSSRAHSTSEIPYPASSSPQLRPHSMPNGNVSRSESTSRGTQAGHNKTHATRRHGKDCIVMTATETDPEILEHSGAQSLVDKSLTVSDLDKERKADGYQEVASKVPESDSPPRLEGALRELKNLENRYVADPDGTHHHQHHNQRISDQQKENVNVVQENVFPLQQPVGVHPNFSSTVHSLNFTQPAQVGYPGALSSGLPLLRLSAPSSFPAVSTGGVAFPRLPIQAWGESVSSHRMVSLQRTQQMPLLQRQTSLYDVYDPPVRDTDPVPQNGAPFPLLRLTAQQDTHVHSPRLIPPELIAEYERDKYQTPAMRKHQVQDLVLREMTQRAAGGHTSAQEPPGRNLLRPDTMEPFGPMDNRDDQKR